MLVAKTIRRSAGCLSAAVVLALIGSVPWAKADLALQGNRVQGGIVVGRVDPGTSIEMNGNRVRVSPDGWFLLGFGRDEKSNVEVKAVYPSGEVERQIVRIKPRQYQIQRIDGLAPGKVSPSAEDLKRIKRENALIGRARQRDDARTDFLESFAWPVTGQISGVFGSQRILNGEPKRPHYGVDIAAPKGTPVKAPAPGTVTLVHPDMFYTGGTVNLDHGHGLTSIFTHLSKILVAEGQRVDKGQSLGEVGATGRATGPHLHWGMNWFKARIDPELLVGEMPVE